MELLQGIAKPEKLSEFRKYHNPNANVVDIPLPLKDRRVTNIITLLFFILCNIVLVLCLVHSLEYADINRRYGFDNCGNVCGIKNAHDVFPCTGKDFTKEKYLVINHSKTFSNIYKDKLPGLWPCERYCAASCPNGYETIVHMCIQPGKNQHKNLTMLMMLEDGLINAWQGVVISSAITLGVTFLFIVFFVYCVNVVIWFNLVALFGLLVFGLVCLWYYYATTEFKGDEKRSPDQEEKSILILSIFATFFFLFFTLCLYFMIRRVKLSLQLFREAAKALAAMPWMVVIPVLGAVSEVIVTFGFTVIFLLLLTCGFLTEIIPNVYYHYKIDVIIFVSFGMCILMSVWYYEFIAGSQYMVVAGATSTWYFAKDKTALNYPILTATVALIRFHLGSVALGSLVITITAIIREVISMLEKSDDEDHICADCIAPMFQEFAEFLSKQAYIQTALHGEPFFRSGHRAAKLVVHNVLNIINLNVVGDVILFISLIFILVSCSVIAVLICEKTALENGVEDYGGAGLFAIGINVIIIFSFFNVIETTIDAIFICFCEDRLLNDGKKRPYAMSKELKNLTDHIKELVEAELERERQREREEN